MQNILRGVFHIIFCSKPLPLQVTPSKVRAAAVGGNNARFGCNLEEGVLNKKLNERYPLIFVEKSPLKIFRINLETPCIMRLLVRDLLNRYRYHAFRKFFTIQRRITDKVLESQNKC